VFILAGQSNMEGKAKLSLLEYQAKQPATADQFKHLRAGDGWAERDDVWSTGTKRMRPAPRCPHRDTGRAPEPAANVETGKVGLAKAPDTRHGRR